MCIADSKFCKAINNYPSIEVGQSIDVPCGVNKIGKITQKCLENGEWSEATNNCGINLKIVI